MIKSNERSCQGELGMGRGWSKPAGHLVSYLTCWHVGHWRMKRLTSRLKVAQWKLACTRCRVLANPRWPPIGVEWNSSSNVSTKGLSSSIQILLLKNNKSS